MSGPIVGGPVQYYETEADMPPAMRARLAAERRTLGETTARYDALMAAVNWWPSDALAIVTPHKPYLFEGHPVCPTCYGADWPCWVITTAEGR